MCAEVGGILEKKVRLRELKSSVQDHTTELESRSGSPRDCVFHTPGPSPVP